MANYVGQLQEYLQKKHVPANRILYRQYPGAEGIFRYEITFALDGQHYQVLGDAAPKSKQAKQLAAQKTLGILSGAPRSCKGDGRQSTTKDGKQFKQICSTVGEALLFLEKHPKDMKMHAKFTWPIYP